MELLVYGLVLINKINSPILRSAVISPLAAGAGHIAGGTTYNLLEGQSFGNAFSNSFDGIGQSMAIGTVLGVTTTIANSYAHKANPWVVKKQTQQFEYDFTPNADGENLTLYRGTTGSENDNGFLFMSNNAKYASSYIKNGGVLVKTVIPQTTIYKMLYNGDLIQYQGLNNTTNIPYIEYRFSPKVKPFIVKNFMN